jgi:hypothetical protein
MTATTTTATTHGERVNWEVVFGPNIEDRQLYPDYGDGAFISTDAETRATRTFLAMVASGIQCGLYRNGVLVSAKDYR